MEIKALTPGDAGDMAEIEARCFSRPWTPGMCRAELEHAHSVYWGAFIGGTLIGYAGLNIAGGDGHITNVAVLPGHRRKGIAKTLIGAMLGLELGLFTLEVRESNAAAINLYSSFGFKVLGKRKNYYNGPDEDALIMTKAENGFDKEG